MITRPSGSKRLVMVQENVKLGIRLARSSDVPLLQAIERHQCTICFTAPTLYRGMAEFVPRYDLTSLKKCVSAGERLPLAVFETWRKATALSIIGLR